MRFAILAVLRFLVFSIVLLIGQVASADSSVRFEESYEGKERKFIHDYLYNKFEHKDFFVNGWMNLERLGVGKFDVNDDGITELFLRLRHFPLTCGTAGCMTLIFRKRNSQWIRVGEFPADWIDVSDREIIGGYRTLRSFEYGARWTGKKYQSFAFRPEGG